MIKTISLPAKLEKSFLELANSLGLTPQEAFSRALALYVREHHRLVVAGAFALVSQRDAKILEKLGD